MAVVEGLCGFVPFSQISMVVSSPSSACHHHFIRAVCCMVNLTISRIGKHDRMFVRVFKLSQDSQLCRSF